VVEDQKEPSRCEDNMELATHAADTEGDMERAPAVSVDGLSVEGDTEITAFDKMLTI
jgi:hypothetical protein